MYSVEHLLVSNYFKINELLFRVLSSATYHQYKSTYDNTYYRQKSFHLKAIEGRWEGDIKIPNQPFPKRYIRKKEILNYLYSKRLKPRELKNTPFVPSIINFWEQRAYRDFLPSFSQLDSDRLGKLISLSVRR